MNIRPWRRSGERVTGQMTIRHRHAVHPRHWSASDAGRRAGEHRRPRRAAGTDSGGDWDRSGTSGRNGVNARDEGDRLKFDDTPLKMRAETGKEI